jgi:hypothetical protein
MNDSAQEVRKVLQELQLDVDDAKINVLDNVAWLSACGVVVQTDKHDKVMPFYVRQMVDLLEDESMDSDAQLMEATHFGSVPVPRLPDISRARLIKDNAD